MGYSLNWLGIEKIEESSLIILKIIQCVPHMSASSSLYDFFFASPKLITTSCHVLADLGAKPSTPFLRNAKACV